MLLRKNLFLSTILVILLLHVSFGLTYAKGLFKRQELQVEGRVCGRIMDDFNNDGLTDLVIFYCEGMPPESRRLLGFFLNRGESGFSAVPDSIVTLPPEVLLVDCAKVNEDEYLDLVFLGTEGVYCLGFTEAGPASEFQLLKGLPTIFSLPEDNQILVWDFVQTDESGKIVRILVPQPRKLVILQRDPRGRFEPTSVLNVSQNFSLVEINAEERPTKSAIHGWFSLPEHDFKDFNGDGREDLFSIQRDYIDIFLADEKGHFNPDPDQKFCLELRTPEERQRQDVYASVLVEDLNSDGNLDLVGTKIAGTVTNYISTVKVFKGRGKGSFSSVPDFEVVIEGSSSTGVVRDFNGDGRKDIIVPSVDIGVMSLIKMLLLKKMNFEYEVYLQDESGNFPRRPDFSYHLSSKLDLRSRNISLQTVGDFDGDVDGDGINDLVVIPGGKLEVFRGDVSKIFDKDSVLEMKFESPTYFKVRDLNNDGRAEIVATFEGKPEMNGKICVLWANEIAF
jgi:hypothetical protein